MQPVLTAVSLLLQKVAEEDPTSTTIDGRFTVPDGAAADAIHGAGGEMLQTIMQQTATQMALAQNPFAEGACTAMCAANSSWFAVPNGRRGGESWQANQVQDCGT